MIMEQRRQIRDLELQASMGQIHATPLSKALTANRDANGYSNYGERLYIEGRIEAMKRDKDIEAARIVAEEAEVAGATFHPQITALALEMKKRQHRDVGFDTNGSGGASSSSTAAPDAAANVNEARGYTPWNRLYKLSSVAEQRRKARIEELERERKQAELAECKFKPQIDPRSARMAANRVAALAENGMAPYDLLYNEADKRRRKLEEAAKKTPEEATFKPVINKVFFSSSKSNRRRTPTSGSSTEADAGTSNQQQQEEEEEEEPTDVALRLLNKGRQYQERLQAARDAVENNPIDPNTGRPLFQPHTRPAPSYLSNKESIAVDEDSSSTINASNEKGEGGARPARRNPGGVPIGEYLYSVKQVQDQKAQETKSAAVEAAVRAASEPKVNPKSERLMERVKQERFRAIFNYLQSRPVGGSSSNSDQQQAVPQSSSSAVVPSINLVAIVSDESFMDSIDPEVRADIEYATQLFLKSQQRQLQSDPSNSVIINRITASQFAALMDRVLAKTRGLARNYLLPMAQTRKAKFQQPTFKPELDARSLTLAARRMRPQGVPGHEVLYKTAEVMAAKREAARREVEAERMAECTFEPTSYVVDGSDHGGGRGKSDTAARYNLMYRQGGVVEGQAENVASPDFFDKEAASEKKVNEGKVMMEKEELQQQQGINNNNKVSKNKKSKQDAPTSIDTLETQINNVLARLSLTGQRLAQGLQEAEANPALLKSSFDYAALFGSREDVAPTNGGGGGGDNNNNNNGASQQQQQPPKAQKIVLTTTSLSSWAGFNPMQAEEDEAGVVTGDLTPVGGKASAAFNNEGMGDSIPAVHSGSPARRQQQQQAMVGGGVRKAERGSLKGLKLAELASL
jgi:hypothetical protein